MTVESPPGVLNGISTDAKVQRRVAQSLAGGEVGAFAGGVGATNGGAHGVAATTHLQVTQSVVPGMSVLVSAGLALITGTVSAEQGPYNFYNDASVTLSIAAAHATQPRTDLVIAQIQDDDYSGASTTPRLHVVTGTAGVGAPTPSLASFPNALVLASINVPATDIAITDAQITDTRTYIGQGIINCTSTNRPTHRVGRHIYEINTKRTWKSDGTNWLPVSGTFGTTLVQSGQAIGSGAAATITFATELADTDAYHAASSTQVVIPAGVGENYSITLYATPGTSVSAASNLVLSINGSEEAIAYIPAGKASISLNWSGPLVAGDVLTVQVFNGHSGSLNYLVRLRCYMGGQ